MITNSARLTTTASDELGDGVFGVISRAMLMILVKLMKVSMGS
jgi:hypothetical protein